MPEGDVCELRFLVKSRTGKKGLLRNILAQAEVGKFKATEVNRLIIGDTFYLGVSPRKMSQMVKDGDVTHERDPLDRRRKLISVNELDALKRRSLGSTQRGARTGHKVVADR